MVLVSTQRRSMIRPPTGRERIPTTSTAEPSPPATVNGRPRSRARARNVVIHVPDKMASPNVPVCATVRSYTVPLRTASEKRAGGRTTRRSGAIRVQNPSATTTSPADAQKAPASPGPHKVGASGRARSRCRVGCSCRRVLKPYEPGKAEKPR